MPSNRAAWLAETFALFDALPVAAQEELGDTLRDLAHYALTLEQTDVPVDTGALKQGLAIEDMISQLRMRIGLVKTSPGRSKLFYGRIVNFGRRAKIVLVQRRRRVSGKLRTLRGRKRAEDIAAIYALHVKARAAVPFIDANRPDLDALVAERLAAFWSNALVKTGVSTA